MSISPNLITGILGFLLTLMVFSYVIGDNPLFKVAIYLFVGVSAGYVAAVAVWQVIVPRLLVPIGDAVSSGAMVDAVLLLVPLLFSTLIILKISPRLSGVGRIAMAFLVGVGAAATIAGAVSGTLIPQVSGTINIFDLRAALTHNVAPIEVIFNGAFVLSGTVLSLSYFFFSAHPQPNGTTRRNWLVEIMAWLGRIFIGITLGAIFAGVYAAALTALIERISSLINFVGNFL